jgi:hypothetical protein
MDILKFKRLFGDLFYSRVYTRWRLNKEKSGKDIVGHQYELFRKQYYIDMGFTLGKGRKIFGTTYNSDLVVKKGNIIVAIEEDKASYVDSCFLGRAIQNAAEVFDMCLSKNIHIPYFIVSSSTKYSKYDEICEKRFRLYREDLQKLLKEKFIYLPLCEHDRVPQKMYFIGDEMCFTLSDKLIHFQNEFVKNL